ncbi:MAG: glycosyltransferase family 2 protein, partial [Mycobacterium sp.]|nr:glycosyltransferase family 2 protein [Mycobacterium sp.]
IFSILGTALPEVHRMRKEYPDAVVLPAASELPAPSELHKAMKPPVNPLAIGYRLSRGVLHNATKADEAHLHRPQRNVPTQDARWFLLCTLDGATVTTADGRGVVFRQRDRAQMLSLLWQSLRRQHRVARRFDTLRKTYRDALPVLSSKQQWETVLLPGNDVPGNA